MLPKYRFSNLSGPKRHSLEISLLHKKVPYVADFGPQ